MLQVFIQESFLAALLLLNYTAITIQHWLRNDGEPLLWFPDCVLTFARAAVPLAMLVISFIIRAYYWDISFCGQVETEDDGADDVGTAAIPGVRQLYKPGWPKPDKWFEWQLRLYWLSSLLMLMHYGNRLCASKSKPVSP